MLFQTITNQINLPVNTLKTTFIEQAPERNWDQPWQDACEEAALLNGYYYKTNQNPDKKTIVEDLNKLFKYESQQGWGHDIDIKKLYKVAKYLNLTPKVYKKPTVSFLKSQIDKKHIVIIPANGKTLYKENKNFKNGGPDYHALALLGYDETQEQFIVHDVGTKNGAYFRYSYNLLMEALHDLPENGNKKDINSGTKRVLVLL